MFSFDAAPTFETTVQIELAGGNVTAIRVTFRYVVDEDYAKLLADSAQQPGWVFLDGLIESWDIKDDPTGRWEGMPAAYSAAELEKLLRKFPRAGRCLMAAYQRETLGFALGN